jgi:hypothetical protein
LIQTHYGVREEFVLMFGAVGRFWFHFRVVNSLDYWQDASDSSTKSSSSSKPESNWIVLSYSNTFSLYSPFSIKKTLI